MDMNSSKSITSSPAHPPELPRARGPPSPPHARAARPERVRPQGLAPLAARGRRRSRTREHHTLHALLTHTSAPSKSEVWPSRQDLCRPAISSHGALGIARPRDAARLSLDPAPAPPCPAPRCPVPPCPAPPALTYSLSLSLSLSLYMSVYIYIYIEREREIHHIRI